MMRVGVIGCGYWGPNLIRNFNGLPGAEVATIADLDPDRLEKVGLLYPSTRKTTDHREIIDDPDIGAVVVATPMSSHFALGMEAIEAGKHVFIEKPMATNSEDCRRLIAAAAERGRTLMVGHTFVYSPPVRMIKDLIDRGELGEIYYANFTRVNLGIFQQDANVLWDLAPHDVAMLSFLFGADPVAVSATGHCYVQKELGVEDVAFLNLEYPGGRLVNIHVSWLDPNKIRRATFVGSRKMLVYDDVSGQEAAPLRRLRGIPVALPVGRCFPAPCGHHRAPQDRDPALPRRDRGQGRSPEQRRARPEGGRGPRGGLRVPPVRRSAHRAHGGLLTAGTRGPQPKDGRSVASRSIRVAMIGQKGYPPVHGGIEKHVAELAARLPALGCDVDIYSRPYYSDRNGPADLPGVRIVRLPSVPTKHLDAITHTILATAHVLPRDVDLVHYHALGPGLLAGVPRWLARKPTVVTVHGLDWQREKWGAVASAVLRLGESASVRLPDRTIVVSRALRKHYLERHRAATEYIPNGIVPPVYREPALIRDLGVDRPFVLFVGRLVPEKGCHLLLAAWSELPRALRESHRLVVAGDAGFTPGYVDRLRREAPAGGLFPGYLHGAALEELYTGAELVVLPSTLEGLSITLLEGMSYGRCCLVSDIPPNREAAEGRAVLFRSGDAADLRARMAELLADPRRREELGAEAQLHAIEEYSWDRVASRTRDLYGEILAAAGRNPPKSI